MPNKARKPKHFALCFLLSTAACTPRYEHARSDSARLQLAKALCEEHGGLVSYDGIYGIDELKCKDGFYFRGRLAD